MACIVIKPSGHVRFFLLSSLIKEVWRGQQRKDWKFIIPIGFRGWDSGKSNWPGAMRHYLSQGNCSAIFWVGDSQSNPWKHIMGKWALTCLQAQKESTLGHPNHQEMRFLTQSSCVHLPACSWSEVWRTNDRWGNRTEVNDVSCLWPPLQTSELKWVWAGGK